MMSSIKFDAENTKIARDRCKLSKNGKTVKKLCRHRELSKTKKVRKLAS